MTLEFLEQIRQIRMSRLLNLPDDPAAMGQNLDSCTRSVRDVEDAIDFVKRYRPVNEPGLTLKEDDFQLLKDAVSLRQRMEARGYTSIAGVYLR